MAREKERKTKEVIENLIKEHIEEVKSLPNKPARVKYMVRIAEKKGISVYKKDITMLLDIVFNKKFNNLNALTFVSSNAVL